MNFLERWYRETFCKWKERTVIANFNGSGYYVPERNSAYGISSAFKGDGYITIEMPPEVCKICNAKIRVLKFRPIYIENKLYYQKYVYECPNGHGHFVDIM